MVSPESSHPPLSRRLWAVLPWLLVLLIGLSVLVAGGLVAEKQKKLTEAKKADRAAEAEAVNVVTLRLVPATMVDSINLPGVVWAWEDLLVKAEVSGRIRVMEVEEGDPVTRGQVLARLDDREYRHEAASIQARLNLARLNFDRLQKLSGQQAVAQAQLDEAEATLNELQAQLASAELDLERTVITAPIAGVINDLPGKTGQLLAQGDPVAQLVDLDRVKIDVAVPEAEVAAVRDVEQARVRLAALGNLEVLGKRIFLARQPSSAAMVYPLRLAVANDAHRILPGMLARVHIVKTVHQNALGVPLYAVITRDDEKFVYVVRDGVAHKRPVELGHLQGWLVRITAGLTAGEEVAIVGHRSLEEGTPVQVLKTVTDPETVLQ